ncbi:MAG: diacylglycerol kinase family protein [Pseudomonadales bacterium]|nr:diacylglycerol kinase family protein [Pseudomonadales bacterium]
MTQRTPDKAQKPDPRQDSFLRQRLNSFGYAFNGIIQLARYETHIQIHLFNTIAALGIFYLLDISATEWMFISISITLVFIAEGLNTAIEKLADAVTEEFSEKIKIVKDIAAGASIIASFNAVFVGLIIVLNNLKAPF